MTNALLLQIALVAGLVDAALIVYFVNLRMRIGRVKKWLETLENARVVPSVSNVPGETGPRPESSLLEMEIRRLMPGDIEGLIDRYTTVGSLLISLVAAEAGAWLLLGGYNSYFYIGTYLASAGTCMSFWMFSDLAEGSLLVESPLKRRVAEMSVQARSSPSSVAAGPIIDDEGVSRD